MKVKSLTQAQKDKLPVYREIYTDKLFGNHPAANKEEVRKYIHWFYRRFKLSKNKKPKVVLVNSPYDIYMAIAFMQALYKRLGKKSEVRNEVGNEVVNEVRNEVRNEVWSEVWNEVGNEVESEVWNEVRNEVGNEVWKSKLTYYSPSYYISAFNAWVSYYDFFDKECFRLKKSKLFNEYKKVLDLNIFWSVPFENVVFVSRNATKYLRDNLKKLHSVFEPAIQFAGGYHLYYVHGVNIKRPLFKKLAAKTFTFDDWVKIDNEELKSACLSFMEERWGSEYLFRFISDNLKEVNTYTDKKDEQFLVGTTGGMNIGVYTLFKGVVNGLKLAFVRCYCPSTDRMFFLCVDPSNTNAKDAIASLYRVPAKLKDEIKYIQRQGERFSTVFTDKGKEVLKSMDEKEIAELTHISGDKYFSKLKYEY